MKRKVTYGKKASTATATVAASYAVQSKVFASKRAPLETISSNIQASKPSQDSRLEELLDKLCLDNNENENEVKPKIKDEIEVKVRSKDNAKVKPRSKDEVEIKVSEISTIPQSVLQPAWLAPLVKAYANDRQKPLETKSWEEVLADGAQVEKIAEASYAEVYRISNAAGSSILKLMCLKPPRGPGSQRETAIGVADVVPEMQILDQLTVIHGFVEFKDAHLVRGTPPKAIVEAYKMHDRQRSSTFPLPSSYAKSTYWLVFELADAGQVLEDFPITRVEEAWDILLGVIIAMYHGEVFCRFEHRDLHENNICIRKIRRTHPPSGRKLGFTNLCVTILDYTLSRAEAENGQVRALDLEQDMLLFSNEGARGTMEEIQFEVYRRMRMLLLNGKNTKSKPSQHTQPIPNNPWMQHIPGTNLLWLDYLFEFVTRQCADTKPAIASFKKETSELRKLLKLNSTCQTVTDILEYCMAKGWITEEDIANYGVSDE